MDKTFVEFFFVLAQFSYTTSEWELNYHHQKVTVRFASEVTEQLKI